MSFALDIWIDQIYAYLCKIMTSIVGKKGDLFMKKEKGRYLTIEEALDYFNIRSRNTLKRNFISRGLPVIVINGTQRIDKLDADKFMQAHKK